MLPKWLSRIRDGVGENKERPDLYNASSMLARRHLTLNIGGPSFAMVRNRSPTAVCRGRQIEHVKCIRADDRLTPNVTDIWRCVWVCFMPDSPYSLSAPSEGAWEGPVGLTGPKAWIQDRGSRGKGSERDRPPPETANVFSDGWHNPKLPRVQGTRTRRDMGRGEDQIFSDPD